MKKLKLLLAFCALLLGWSNASAYTVSDLTSAGWTQVTDLASLTLDDNYFMFVDAGTSLYSVTNARPGTDSKPTYQALQNPTADWAQVWKLSKDAQNNYLIQSKVDDWYFISAANENQGWTDKMSSESTNGGFTFEALGSNKYSIKGVFSKGFVGPWNDDGAVNLNNNLHWGGLEDNYYEELACNKNDAQSPDFYIYYISRTSYDAARRSSATLETEGWSKVTATSGLGKAGYYYTFLDLSENGYETGLAMIGTNGRPQYTSVADPVSNTTQLWTTESHGVGYALKNVGVDKYFYLATADTWNTGFTSDINAKYTDFIANVSEGKWTLSNSLNTAQFVGRWSNSPYAPGKDEDIAANKAADAGKRQFYIYSIPTIAGVAEALPGNGDMTADTWYYIDIPATADNYTATATALANIVYTSDGATLVKNGSTVTNQFTETDNSLTATRYYVKSSMNNNLVIGVSSYTYSVGSPTSSIANNAYIASLSTIDFTFSDAGTTDPDASFALLNGSAKAVLSKGGENVAEGTLSLSGKVLTATFSDVALALSSTYDIAIAAGVVGYEGKETNAAINTSFRTGVIADGVYYFKKNDADLYITRGGWYGTEGVVDNFGLSFEVSAQADGTYTLKNIDHSLAANADKFLKCDGSTYTDQTAFNWTIEATDGGYYLRPSNTEYMAATAQGEYNYSYLSKTTDASSAYVWTLLSKSEYAAAIAAAKNSQATAIATAAGISATTVAELESALAANYGATNMTSSITNAALTANMDGWTQVKYNGVTFKDADANGTTAEIWNSTGGVKQDIEGLPAGLYKVTVVATWRPGNLAAATRVGAEANTTAWMYANTGTATNITQLKSWYEGGATINSRADLVTNKANYTNTTYVYVAEDETLTIGLASPSFCVEPWFPFFDWTLTYYEAKATPAEKTTLANAISDAESNTLGFENGEYAPYNNIDALTKLAAAKAINPETASGAAVVAATTALTGAIWTANVGEVNAIRWNKAEDYSSEGETKVPTGGFDESDANSRISHNPTSNAGLTGLDQSMALMVIANTNATYGVTDGYTLPLKASTVYEFKFKYAGWGECGTPTIAILKDSETIKSTTLSAPAKTGNNNTDAWEAASVVFQTTDAGDYKVRFSTADGRDAFGDLELKKAAPVSKSISSAGYATFCSPYALDLAHATGLTDAYIVTGATGSVLNTTSVKGGTIPANTGILIEAPEGTVTIPVVASSSTDVSGNKFQGVTEATEIAVEAGYVLMGSPKVGFYQNEKTFTVGANTAYLPADFAEVTGGARSAYFFRGDITGVDNVEAAAEATLKDGKYLENGKIVIVKNGQKFNAAGAQMK